MKRYTVTVRTDTQLIERVKEFFEKEKRGGLEGANSHVISQIPGPHQFNLPDAFTIMTERSRGVVIPLKARDEKVLYSQEIHLLVTIDYRDEFCSEVVCLVPDYATGERAFTGTVVPAFSAVSSLRATSLKISLDRLQYGSVSLGVYSSDREEVAEEPMSFFEVEGAHYKIGDIKDYLKCFDNNPDDDHKYEVTLCVSQPRPGTRESWDFSKESYAQDRNPVFVGHVFLVMKEQTPFKTIVRNVGFYPEGNVSPYDPSDQGCLNNDSYTSFNVGLKMKVTSHEFNQILNYLAKGNNKGYLYNLHTNNCTNFVLDALSGAGITIPRTVGKWHHGSGLNPGDLGEDLRSMKLSSNMTLITVYQAHGNQGSCN